MRIAQSLDEVFSRCEKRGWWYGESPHDSIGVIDDDNEDDEVDLLLREFQDLYIPQPLPPRITRSSEDDDEELITRLNALKNSR